MDSSIASALRAPTLMEAAASADSGQRFLTFWRPGTPPVEESQTFGEFFGLARRCADLLVRHGIGRGDRVALVMPAGPMQMASFVGAMMIGAIPAILAYPNFKIDPEKFRHGLFGVTTNLNAKLVCIDAAFRADLYHTIATSANVPLCRIDPPLDIGSIDAPDLTPALPSDIAFIQHSAGTTGLQKGVALSHASVLTQLRHLADALRIDTTDRIVSWLPLYHDMGLIATFMLPLACHLPVVLQSPADWVLAPWTNLELVSSHRGTLCWMPNFAFQFLARRTPDDVKRRLDLRSLRALVNCSEPVRAQSHDEFIAAFGSCGLRPDGLQASYAMAENTFAVTQTGTDGSVPARLVVDRDALRDSGRAVVTSGTTSRDLTLVSSGRCIAGNEIRVVDENGAEVPERTVGEFLVRSDSMLTCYYNRPDLTAQALDDGWYRTKDFGFVDGDDTYVLGRKDDTIIIAGRNIWPADVEEIVSAHTAVHDGRAVAFGVLNAALGTDDLIIVVESDVDAYEDSRVRIQREIQTAVAREFDVPPRLVQLVPPRWIVKSSAGKAARSTTRAKFLREFGPALGIAFDALD